MAAEYLANGLQSIPLNTPIEFTASMPCTRGNVIHENGTGIFILKGNTNQCYATYKVSYNGNIAITEGGTVTPIAVAIVVNGEPRLTSRAISTPAAAEQFNSVTSPATIKVPRGCCFTLAVEYVSGITDGTTVPTPVIDQINGNLEINRIA
ncbi:MAG: hypothetical protein J6Y15_07940 [Bacteroidaceae bacterium]|nr:hypothetical protein [Bacteroidaceae bacterium]